MKECTEQGAVGCVVETEEAKLIITCEAGQGNGHACRAVR